MRLRLSLLAGGGESISVLYRPVTPAVLPSASSTPLSPSMQSHYDLMIASAPSIPGSDLGLHQYFSQSLLDHACGGHVLTPRDVLHCLTRCSIPKPDPRIYQVMFPQLPFANAIQSYCHFLRRHQKNTKPLSRHLGPLCLFNWIRYPSVSRLDRIVVRAHLLMIHWRVTTEARDQIR
jgi:hypothetical protein